MTIRAASANGGNHAWWTYVVVTRATPDGIQFLLKSDGQFVGFIKDAFYTGKVLDPHTGRTILDTDMHRQLNMAGNDKAGLRHVTLLMRHYTWLAQKLNWDTQERLAFIDKCIKICPLYEEPWVALAALAKNEKLDADGTKFVRAEAASVLTHFKNYPDFISRIFNDLLFAFEPAEQVKLNLQAVALCEKAGRPDLSCNLRLRISGAGWPKDSKWQTAADGLIVTIYRFPTEGRFVPKLTQRLQDMASKYKGGTERLAQVYLDIVPRLYVYYRADADATYHKTLYAQAMNYFESHQLDEICQ